MSRAPNAFELLRPRMAGAAPGLARVPSLAQAARAMGEPMVLDRLGRPTTTLAPRRYSGGTVEGRAAAQAGNDRQRALRQTRI